MRVGLIDVDGHNYPNLPLMKLSAWHKARGDAVEWHDGFAPVYDVVYMSKVFSEEYTPDEMTPANARRVIRRGSGYCIHLKNGREEFDSTSPAARELPFEIEHIYPDYSLYPEYTKDKAYGFLTRGCPRRCSFCHVAGKEGPRSYRVAWLTEFWKGQKQIELLDPNVLACPSADEILDELLCTGARVEFNQGLDARLMTPERADKIARMSGRSAHFAMDQYQSRDAVLRGLAAYAEALDRQGVKWRTRPPNVYILTNYDTTHEQDLARVEAVQSVGFDPFVMIYNKGTAPAVTRRLARWANNKRIYGATGKRFENFDGKMG